MDQARYVRFFETIGIDDVPLVGGKNASLGEMYREARRRWACACRTASRSRPRPIAHVLDAGGRLAAAARRARRPATPRRRRPGAARRRRRARSSTARRPAGRPRATRSSPPTRSLQAEYGEDAQPSRCAARRPPRTCRRPASPASRRPTSTSTATTTLLDAVPALLRQPVHRPRDQLPRSTTASTISRWRCRSAS